MTLSVRRIRGVERLTGPILVVRRVPGMVLREEVLVGNFDGRGAAGLLTLGSFGNTDFPSPVDIAAIAQHYVNVPQSALIFSYPEAAVILNARVGERIEFRGAFSGARNVEVRVERRGRSPAVERGHGRAISAGATTYRPGAPRRIQPQWPPSGHGLRR